MKTLLCLFLLLGSQAQAAKLACMEGAPMHITVLAESGCPSGLVLLNVETACIDAASPAFASLKANSDYDTCLESRLDSSGKFYQAHIFLAKKAN